MSRLKASLGLISLSLFGIGMIVGAGIYSVIGAAAGKAGDALWASFLIGAVAAFLTGLAYAELATSYPEAGAEYIYLGRAFPKQRWLAFLGGFIIVVAAGATVATVALAFGGYLRLFVDFPLALAAGLLMLACAAINIVGIRQSTIVNAVLTLIELGGLVLVIFWGLKAEGFGSALSAPLTPGIFTGAALIFFVYLGFEDIANLSEEARRPSPDIPRAIVIAMAVTSVLYVLVALSVSALSDPQSLAGSESPLASTLESVSPASATALGWIALVATSNTALIGMIVSSRMLFSMARSGDLPKPVASLLPGRKTPWLAALVVLGLSLLCLPLGKVEIVASVSSVCTLLAFLLVNISLVVLRKTQPRRKRPFRVPLSVGIVPLPVALGTLCILLLLTQFELLATLIGLGVIAVGLAAFFTLSPGRGKPFPRETPGGKRNAAV